VQRLQSVGQSVGRALIGQAEGKIHSIPSYDVKNNAY
jgi:hypothetical protein